MIAAFKVHTAAPVPPQHARERSLQLACKFVWRREAPASHSALNITQPAAVLQLVCHIPAGRSKSVRCASWLDDMLHLASGHGGVRDVAGVRVLLVRGATRLPLRTDMICMRLAAPTCARLRCSAPAAVLFCAMVTRSSASATLPRKYSTSLPSSTTLGRAHQVLLARCTHQGTARCKCVYASTRRTEPERPIPALPARRHDDCTKRPSLKHGARAGHGARPGVTSG